MRCNLSLSPPIPTSYLPTTATSSQNPLPHRTPGGSEPRKMLLHTGLSTPSQTHPNEANHKPTGESHRSQKAKTTDPSYVIGTNVLEVFTRSFVDRL